LILPQFCTPGNTREPKFIVLPPPLDRGRGGHQEAGVIPPQDHQEVGGGLLQPDLQGGVVEHLDAGNRPVKDARISAIRGVQNVREVPLDGRGIRRGAIVEADAWMQVKDVGAAIVRDVVWSKYPNALLYHRLRLHHDTSFSLNFTVLSPILIMHVRRLGRGEREMDWEKLLGSIPASVDEEIRLRNAYLVTENRMLRPQITGRVQLTDSDRKALAELGQKLGKQALEAMATVAKPDTILAWHRMFSASAVRSFPVPDVCWPSAHQ